MLLVSFGNGWVACARWATLSLGGSGGECPGDSISHGVDRYVMLPNQEPATMHPFFCTMPAAVDKYRRLDAWGRGQAVAFAEEGYSSSEIAQRVREAPMGGRLGPHPDARSVRHLVRKARQDPSYRGESRPGPGRKPQLTEKEQQKLCELVFEHRGGSSGKHNFLPTAFAFSAEGVSLDRRPRASQSGPGLVAPAAEEMGDASGEAEPDSLRPVAPAPGRRDARQAGLGV